MINSQIRWKKGDFITLGKAVSAFNKKRNLLLSEENKLYFPDEIDYKEIKNNITTRQELNRIVKSLKRFSLSGAEELYETEAGEQITKWERKELGIQSRIAQNRLKQELKQLNEPLESGYSRVQMGSIRAREIEAQIRNLRKIETKTGYEFRNLINRIKNVGTSDYEMRKAIVYRKNYFTMLESYKNYDNYDLLVNELNKHQNPIEFYEFISQNELLADITFMYEVNSDFGLSGVNDQMRFNYMIETLGIEVN